MFPRIFSGFLLTLTLLFFNANAATPATLEISGNITRFTDKATRTYQLSEDAFLKMPQSTLRTSTTWTPVTDFSGVKMTALMKLVGAKGTIAEFHTLDNYVAKVPISDFAKYGVILARKMNNMPMTTANFGPYFLIYPKDNYAIELKSPESDSKFPWQVNKIIIK